jgi:folylpolyglutamate synthase/dihydropteroate synthase
VIFAPIYSTRATPMRDLLAAAAATGTPAYAASSVNQAIELAFEHAAAHPSSPIVVSGSVYLVGDVRTRLLARNAPAGVPGPIPERVGQLP